MLVYMILLGYLYKAPTILNWMGMPVAITTGFCFLALVVAVIFIRQDTWLIRRFIGDSGGSLMARRLLPWLMFLPVILGWLRITGEKSGFFNSETGVILIALTYTFCFLFLIWFTAKGVNRIDNIRRKTETALAESEQRVRNKLDSILSPTADIANLELADIIDIQEIQSLIDNFYSLTNFPVSIIGNDGKILVGAGWQTICLDYHRVNPRTCANCVESDTQLTKGVKPGEFKLYKCKNHMWDIATPIMIADVQVGNLFSGQFFFDDEEIDYDLFRESARLHKFDESRYMKALDEVPRFSRKTVEEGMQFYIKLATIISKISHSNLKLARTLSERDALTADLKESHEKLRITLGSIGDGVLTTNNQGRVNFLNPVAETITGWTLQEASGLPVDDVFQIIDEKSRQPAENIVKKVLTLGSVVTLANHSSLISRNGTEIPVEDSAAPIKDNLGNVIGVVLVFHDVSEKRKASAALQKVADQNKFLANVIELAGQPFAVGYPDGSIGTLNHAFEILTGYSLAELHSINWAEKLTPPEWRQPEGQQLEVLNRTGNPVRYEKEYIRKDGTRVPIELLVHLVKDEWGNPQYYYSFITDITDRKQAEMALKTSEEQFRTLAESLPALIWTTGVNGQINYMNRRYGEYTGFRKLEDDLNPILSGWKELVNGIPDFKTEALLRRHDGVKRWFLVHIVERHNIRKEFIGWIGTATDIHDIKLAEALIRDMNSELDNRVKSRTAELEEHLREMEAFSYSISHDLRAPIRHLSAYANRLLNNSTDTQDDTNKRYLKVISDSADNMGKLIDAILSYTRIGRTPITRTGINLNEMIEEVRELLMADQGHRKISWKIEPLPEVTGDPLMLKVAFTNLLSNAIKFTRHKPEAEITIGSADGNGSENIIFVRDNGVGFDNQYNQKLFKLFERLHPSDEFEGTGLGLANVGKIIQRHGGRTWAEGEAGKGAVFYLTLPH
jgi:PAS domain S-box-containing protein